MSRTIRRANDGSMQIPCFKITLLCMLIERCFGGRKGTKSPKAHKRVSSLSTLLAASSPPPASIDIVENTAFVARSPSIVPSTRPATAQETSTFSSLSSSTELNQIPTLAPSVFGPQHGTSSTSTSPEDVSLEEEFPTSLSLPIPTFSLPRFPPPSSPPAELLPATLQGTSLGGTGTKPTLPPILSSPISTDSSATTPPPVLSAAPIAAQEIITRQTVVRLPIPDMQFSIVTLSGQPLAVAEVNYVVEQFLTNFLLSIEVIPGEEDTTDHAIHLVTTMFQTEETSATDVTIRSTVTTAVNVENNDSVAAAAIAYDDSAESATRMTLLLAEYIRSHGHEMKTGLSAMGAVLDLSSWTLRSSDSTKLSVLAEETSSSTPTPAPASTPTQSPSFFHRPGAIALLIVGCFLLCLLTAPIVACISCSGCATSDEEENLLE